jgi:RimJ/RimL family protein N-acetyltransferase
MLEKSKIETMAEAGFVLRGDKIQLRPFTALDIDDAYIGWLNDPDVVRFSNQRFLAHDRESCLRYLASFEGTDNLFMSARLLSDDRPVGTLTAYVSTHHGTVDVGIMIGDKSVWGMGYGQDAWNTLTNWLLCRKDIRKLTAGTLACNYGMIKLMERSGMTLEAVRKAQEMVEGRPEDILHYAKFNAGWLPEASGNEAGFRT